MMNTVKYVKVLEEKGFTKEQAVCQLEVVGEIMNDNFATKKDLKDVGVELKSEIASVRTELKSEIASVRIELKSEIASVRTELKTEIASVRTELKSEIASVRVDLENGFKLIDEKFKTLENKIILKMVPAILLCLGLMSGIQKYFN